jgi:hypothetical protein
MAEAFDDCTKGDLQRQTSCLICRAIYNNDDDALDKLVPSPYANLNSQNGCSFLFEALMDNNDHAFKVLVDNGANPNQTIRVGGFDVPLIQYAQSEAVRAQTQGVRYRIDIEQAYRLMLSAGLHPNTRFGGNNYGMTLEQGIVKDCTVFGEEKNGNNS